MHGKISRLPKSLRDQLNQRLDDGQPADEILKWLNEQPQCKRILAEQFDSRPITKQNLSQWKLGGFQTWLQHQQAREQVDSLLERAIDLDKDPAGLSIADRIATVLSVQLLAATQKLDAIADAKERWQQLKDILRELSRLRREDHHARRVAIAREQWEEKWTRQQDQDEHTAKKQKKKKLLNWLRSLHGNELDAQLLGGGEYGHKWAKWFHCVKNDLPFPNDMPLPHWWTDNDDSDDDARILSPSQSKPVKVNQGKSRERKSAGRRTKRKSKSNESGAQANNRSESKPPAERQSPVQPEATPSAPDTLSDQSAVKADQPSPPSSLPSAAEMARAIAVRQHFK